MEGNAVRGIYPRGAALAPSLSTILRARRSALEAIIDKAGGRHLLDYGRVGGSPCHCELFALLLCYRDWTGLDVKGCEEALFSSCLVYIQEATWKRAQPGLNNECHIWKRDATKSYAVRLSWPQNVHRPEQLLFMLSHFSARPSALSK